MSRFASRISRLFKGSSKLNRRSKLCFRRRLEFETLEDRCVPSTASGVISGVAFVDALGKGSFTSTDATLPGINLTLAGKTDFQQIPVSVTTTTDANGAYTFANVLPGTYGISGTGGSVILGANSVSGLVVSGGQT